MVLFSDRDLYGDHVVISTTSLCFGPKIMAHDTPTHLTIAPS